MELEETNIETEQKETKLPFNWMALVGLIMSVGCMFLCSYSMGWWIGCVLGNLFSIAGFSRWKKYNSKWLALIGFIISLIVMVGVIVLYAWDGYDSATRFR
ncbi:MAG: hypothetical protein LUC31_00475 [Coprobacillus sp.]|nr:hypothetical protein [Coprobacillus sp.]